MRRNVVYGYLDESPSLRDEAFFFCVDILSTSDRTNKRLKNILKRARKKVLKKKLKSLSEIKFYNSDERTRTYILSEIAEYDVRVVVLVVDKEKRRVKDTPFNYGIVAGATVAEFLSVYPALNLTMDKKFTNDEQEREFLRITQETIQTLVPTGKNIFFNPPKDSKKESLLQLADFAAGAMNFKYNQHDNHYADIIKDKIVVEKVVKWTKLKKRIVNP